MSGWLNWLRFAALALLLVGAFLGIYRLQRWFHRRIDAWFDSRRR